ncbi:MAG: 50S ribosomal protein L11 methyltransferase [endosymbiont of Galathealinum brachiosum]|uniref:Ribosomal protein L11 methyltransferase n=1 Tax=endosymbiont of Galathealinum brachiosum TaxID=2200906 RepID=A0A370D9M1_9GAMM|nr:MAG: 50S ribosomal protein L11 methyltransferase [endosymbiont of Galathealinum brachiosum]
MPWIQLILQTDKANNDKAEETLLDAGALSVTFKDAEDNPVLEPLPGETPLWDKIILTGLFEADINTESLKSQILSQLGEQTSLKLEALEDKDWVRAWMDDYKPMQFGNRLWVCPKHLPPPQADAVNLMLDPGLAFGTGTHPTTALCLEWLDSIDAENGITNKSVLDFGCGSGVLAIAALLLGAEHCDGTDIDPQAIIASKDNALENNVNDKLDLYLPKDMPDNQSHEYYDIVLANILAGPLTELAEQLANYCRTGGDIVLSGILETQSDKIIQAYSPWFNLDPIAVKDDWIRVTGKKK